MRVVVDRDLCEANGVCVSTAPEVFQLHDDMLVILDAAPTGGLQARVEDAVDGCPRAALRLLDH